MLILFIPVIAATPVSVSVPTLVIEALIFLAMVFFMEKLVFAPIRRAWRGREESIQAGLLASGETRNEAQGAREEVRSILTAARREAQRAIDEVTAEGNRLRGTRIEEATAEFQRLLDEARSQIRNERAQAAQQMRNLVVDLALEAAARVTGGSYGTPEARRLAASVVEQESLA